MKIWDIVIVGAGPAGLAAGIYAGRSQLKTIILDQMLPGGQLLITEFIENYPGFYDGISGFELSEKLRIHAEKFGTLIENSQPVIAVNFDGELFNIKTENKELKGKTLIWAAGSTAKKLNIPGEAEFVGRGVSYCAVCDGAFFKDRIVAVVGGGDSALEEALYLTKFASKVYLIHRRDKFRAVKLIQDRVKKNEKIEPILNKIVVSINGTQFVESLTLKDTQTGEITELPVDGIFIFIGNEPNVAPILHLVETTEKGFIITDEEMKTKTPGLFAAGDVRHKPLKQVVTATADGATAAMSAAKFLEEKEG
ncbi:thioredoxin reductase [Desulfurobacterium thermolithotrophum DSM 11699]|uniref:Thioredoxin reductase n=1 Tax=Desulfurobacterium thermolithotrophum (strain DSM 11699 / BSA) TaxID=868864 RepID=F0S0P1_DESTD|nr:thioredoxin-disulfide reductase [Desulfurobacterium thermolithotrophum]ADY73844.1 thioredoxin reductase [Desulfurobacterium thermolithotrophum DSM 11699]